MQPDEKSYCAIRTPELCGIALKNVTIGNGTEEVGGFDNCPNLKSLVLPESVKYYTAGKGTANGNYNGIRNLTVNNRNCIISGIDSLAEGITITAYCGSPAHKAAVKRNAHFVSLGHEYLDWYTVTPASKTAEGTERRDCAYCDHYEERTIPMLRDETHKATFVADGQVVSVVEFTDAMTSIEEPPVPAKDRYLGEWEDYTLGDEDITVNAVYTLIKAEDAEDIQTDSIAELYDKTDDVLFTVKASSAAKTVKSTISQSIPLDIVLVADQSGSMADSLGGTQTKVEALKEAAAGFVAQVSANAKATGADHRIAIAGFGLAGNYTGYQQNENTELLTTASGAPIVYHNIKPSDYAGALLPVLSGSSTNPSVTAAVNAIDARGATAADLGLEMAKSIFANTDSSGRQRVVVFMTDGEPTYSSSFQTSVANSAIANARVLKNTYDATVYSIGVFDDTQAGNKNIQAFMNAVSSDHPNAVSLKNLGQKQSEHFFMTVGHTDALSNVFRTITTESLSHTAAFDKLTLIKTLSKYVTLTAPQEQALRVSLIRRYGITNDQITVVRRDNGTTEIKVTGLTPYEVTAADGSVSYEVSVSFFASLNELAVTEGDYAVDTEDSGIMLGDGARGYEATFTPSVVTNVNNLSSIVLMVFNRMMFFSAWERAVGSNGNDRMRDHLIDFLDQFF
ncbi:MAG: vWA domain-containing protein, partial [Ruminococcus sp.]|nr:vWA domain-containing protein [Ruminococcus sp.]